MKRILKILYTVCLILSTGCVRDNSMDEPGGTAVMSFSISAVASSINQDYLLWEDRVNEVRMLVFDSGDGGVVINRKLYFPDGFDQPSRAVEIDPGTYDFYFIANETAYSGTFVSALLSITNKEDFNTDARFRNLDYDPEFFPDAASQRGRFLMSALYEGVTVVSGGTQAAPIPLPIPTATVELIRSLAKVEVVFRKRVPGSDIPDNAINSVRLENVASSFSVPPLDSYYSGQTQTSSYGDLSGLDYTNDSIGSVVFYIPEFLVDQGTSTTTVLDINNETYPIESDQGLGGLAGQRRNIPSLSPGSVIRNYHYLINAWINAEGGVQLIVTVKPWSRDVYTYIFQGDLHVVIPPVIPTDSSIIIPTDCGTVEILSENEYLGQGLQGAYNDIVEYWSPEVQGPRIIRGDPPYYCEKKYGAGWRLFNSCELLSFLAAFDMAYNIWMSNTWEADSYNLPYYPRVFRQAAQLMLEKLTGVDLSDTVLQNQNDNNDQIPDMKLGIIDDFFTPGDIVVRPDDFPGGWPYAAPPNPLSWYYNEVVIQVVPFWYGSEYVSYTYRDNWDEILYNKFERYDFSSTVSRCVRTVE